MKYNCWFIVSKENDSLITPQLLDGYTEEGSMITDTAIDNHFVKWADVLVEFQEYHFKRCPVDGYIRLDTVGKVIEFIDESMRLVTAGIFPGGFTDSELFNAYELELLEKDITTNKEATIYTFKNLKDKLIDFNKDDVVYFDNS